LKLGLQDMDWEFGWQVQWLERNDPPRLHYNDKNLVIVISMDIV
jgi:hypothetical protein